MNIWVTYTVRYSTASYHPTDHEPPTYYNVSFHADEIGALRFANTHGAKAIEVTLGQTLEDAVFPPITLTRL